MHSEFGITIEAVLRAAIGSSVTVRDSHGLSGGCINSATQVEMSDGSRWVVKSNDRIPDDMFACEFAGLQAIGATGTLRVPTPLALGQCEATGRHYLIMEAITCGPKTSSFDRDFGIALATFHRRGRGERYGFTQDNYIGSTPQPNRWCESWPEFFAEHRLGFQLQLAERNRVDNGELRQAGARLLERIPGWLTNAEPPTLIHGDLWGGNYLIDTAGQPVLIDPAVYYGTREAELAITSMFGGFSPEFYDGYRSEWPLQPGSEKRIELYQLYHLLNHLNLFGHSYLHACVRTANRLLQDS